jgi:cyclic pyranopterin phosphate synthase
MALPQLPLRDLLGRPLESLRVSVTDRCNLRCVYCMPEKDYIWLPREELLTFEELTRLVGVFTDLGVDRVRLTGGEPLLRQHLHRLVKMLAANPRIRDLALTTNGVLLADQAAALKNAGLHRVTLSLDTLRPDRFLAMSQRDEHARVLEGFAAAQSAGFTGTKLDAVIVRGVNDDELAELIEFGRAHAAEVRFIEYMDVGGATQWTGAKVFSRDEMLARLEARYGKITPVIEESSAPASRFTLPDGTVFGIIASTTAPFCQSCNRSRVTADGMWFRCLYATTGTDLRKILRASASHGAAQVPGKGSLGKLDAAQVPGSHGEYDEKKGSLGKIADDDAQLARVIEDAWSGREDRGAEQRHAERFRGAFIPLDELRRNPHLEMHTRGG